MAARFKHTLQSRTVWAAVVAFAAIVASYTGVPFTEGEQAELLDLITTTVAGIGTICAILYRIIARKQLIL